MTDCEQCGHPFDPHEFRGDFTVLGYGIEVPVAGWIRCQEDDCPCWSTWSINHPDLPTDLVAMIEQYLVELRRSHEAEGDEIALAAYEDGLMEDTPWALDTHTRRFPQE